VICAVPLISVALPIGSPSSKNATDPGAEDGDTCAWMVTD
jgi:hypothetical protein